MCTNLEYSMINKFTILLLLFFLSSFQSNSFKNNQLKFAKVRQAYKDKGDNMTSLLLNNQIHKNELRIYLRAFKNEKQIELWGKNNSDTKYTLITTYTICRTSGKAGPKRKQGDFQIPEGFYHINKFNPYSSYYLSLGINYPNTSDNILGNKENIGGDIFIHGSCVTVGCLPITNEQIKELYIFCVEARNNGQMTIPITIFPAKLTQEKFKQLSEKHNSNPNIIGLWTDLKKGYDIFNSTNRLPTISFLQTGRHTVKK
ncbi:MAG: L,D-transpeptidase family protein [Bacteroidales bacterium]